MSIEKLYRIEFSGKFVCVSNFKNDGNLIFLNKEILCHTYLVTSIFYGNEKINLKIGEYNQGIFK